MSARVVLMPSLWEESFGRVAAEAMANGIPVLSSDRGALPETVGAGRFVEPPRLRRRRTLPPRPLRRTARYLLPRPDRRRRGESLNSSPRWECPCVKVQAR